MCFEGYGEKEEPDWDGSEMEPSPGEAGAMYAENIDPEEYQKAYDEKMRVW